MEKRRRPPSAVRVEIREREFRFVSEMTARGDHGPFIDPAFHRSERVINTNELHEIVIHAPIMETPGRGFRSDGRVNKDTMKIRELKDVVTKALEKHPECDPENALMRFAQPVEAADQEAEMTVELGDPPTPYRDDTWHDVTTTVYFDIEDFEALYNVTGTLDGVVLVDAGWKSGAKSVSAAEFMRLLDACDEDAGAYWTFGGPRRSGDFADSAGVQAKGRTPFYGDPGGARKYDWAVTIGTDEVDDDPGEEAVRQYVEENDEWLREQAYERALDQEADPRGGDYDEDDWRD